MAKFEYSLNNEQKFEAANKARIHQVYTHSLTLFTNETRIDAVVDDADAKQVALSAHLGEPGVVELAAVLMGEDEPSEEERYQLRVTDDELEFAYLADGEWFSVDPKEPSAAPHIQGAQKITLRLEYAQKNTPNDVS